MTTDNFKEKYVGTIVGESTSREFRLAVAREAIREQDIIAVDASLNRPGNLGEVEEIRVWAKVQRIERLNPLFPSEAGHELAETRTDPFDTVLSLSREMVTAVCQVIGVEPRKKQKKSLDQLRYPPQPASSAYRPDPNDIKRIVLGTLDEGARRSLDIAVLSNRPEVDVIVDGHSIVSRHLAILAMTGAGKSVTARKIIEELAMRNYPIVIFDPHGEYSQLGNVSKEPEEGENEQDFQKRIKYANKLNSCVDRYYAQFPVFEQDADAVVQVIQNLSGSALSQTQSNIFDDLFVGGRAFIEGSPSELQERTQWLSQYLNNEAILQYGIKPNLFFLADYIEAIIIAARDEDHDSLQQIIDWSNNRTQLRITRQIAGWIEPLVGKLRKTGKKLHEMEKISQKFAQGGNPIPINRKELVRYGKISVISLAGYSGEFQATLYSLIASDIFSARVSGDLKYPVLFLLEEAHNFAPAHANTPSESQAISITKQIAQEGRKFGVGLILISQRPSRLDETTLSQCNSYIIMRMVNPADQNYVRRVVETLGEDEANLLPDLDVGEAILSGQLVNFPILTKIKPPVSKGEREERDAFDVLEEAYRESNNKRK